MRSRLGLLLLVAAVATAALLGVARASQDGGSSRPELGPVFTVGTLNNFPHGYVTSLAFGPDGRLYVATIDYKIHSSPGEITALTLDATGTQVIESEGITARSLTVLGLAFDPLAPAEPVVVFASGRDASAPPGLGGIVSTFTAPDWTREDFITGLSDCGEHGTDGIAFDDTGRLLIGQGGGCVVDTPVSGAVLVADIHDPAFDGHITYEPPQPVEGDLPDIVSGNVKVFAPGFRNPYDLVVHTNGHIYATDNGGSYGDSPNSREDEVDLVEEGKYYGVANVNRGRHDPRQLIYHPGDEPSGDDFTSAIFTGCPVCEGLAEYTSDAFDGVMQGDLISIGYWYGEVWRLDVSNDGEAIAGASVIGHLGSFDVAVGPTGIIYGGGGYLQPNGLAPFTPTPTLYFTTAPTPMWTLEPTRTLAPTPVATGDANWDGVTDSRDAALVLQRTAGLPFEVPCSGRVDMDGNGLIDSRDALLILQCSAGLRAC